MKVNAQVPDLQTETPALKQPPGLHLQRKCVCGGGPAGMAGVCKQCDGRRLTLQRYSIHPAGLANAAGAKEARQATGSPSPTATADGIIHHSFADVPVRNRAAQRRQEEHGPGDAKDPLELEASPIEERPAFGFPEAPPSPAAKASTSAGGTHPGNESTREARDEGSPPTSSANGKSTGQPSAGLIVEDDVEVAFGQMRKSEFIAELREAVRAAADAELAGTGRSTRDCPYLDAWLGYYNGRSGSYGERALRRYAPEAAGVSSARDYVPIVAARVQRSVATWAKTGEITGVPNELSDALKRGALSQPSEAATKGNGETASQATEGADSSNATPAGSHNGAREDGRATRIQQKLGAGRSLDGGVMSKMESAFGHNFAQVRVHTDSVAAGISSDLRARAFTVGSDIAFGTDEYQPGTLVGDALLAHELAHVVQQRKAHTTSVAQKETDGTNESLEEDADQSAIGAMASLWSSAAGKVTSLARRSAPQLGSGVGLRRCNNTTNPTVHDLEVENQDASLTYLVPSSSGGGGKKHWVTIADPAGTKPIVKAKLSPDMAANDARAAGLQWTIDGAATPSTGDPLHLEVPRDVGKRVVKAQLGTDIKEITTWALKVVVTSPAVVLSPAPTGAAPYSRTATKNFTGTINPAEMINDPDHPDLTGGRTVAPAGNNYCGVSLAGGADHKWDMSRQLNQVVINPNAIPAPAGPPAGPPCFWAAVPFPADDATGNDDTTATDETNDPYTNGGVITSNDTPGQPIPDGIGANGNTLEWQLNFREFARLEHNRVWRKVSAFFPWQVIYKAKKVAGRWIDNGSSAAP